MAEMRSFDRFPYTINDIAQAWDQIADHVERTPVLPWHRPDQIAPDLAGTRITLKLEVFQKTGTFKIRGALLNMMSLTPAERENGVLAVSAGNHAIAVAVAAKIADIDAKVVIIEGANPMRVEKCRDAGATILFAEDAAKAFELADEIATSEKRTLVHPFDGEKTVLGSATLGKEIMEQFSAVEAIVIPVGGGGLLAGVSTAARLIKPDIEIYGVEPTGADAMARSLALGHTTQIDRITTIADSLGSPKTMQFSFDLCRQNLTDLVLVNDDQLRDAMRLLFSEAKLAVEPAAAAATAALKGPLKERLKGKNVCLLACGSNIDARTYANLLADH